MQTAEVTALISALPDRVAQAVEFSLVGHSSPHERGQRVLALAELVPACGAKLRSIALQVGFDPLHKVRGLA